MPFLDRDVQEIVEESVGYLSQDTNITNLSPGAKARALLEAHGVGLDEAYKFFDLNLARAFLSSAPGQYLELIGVLLQLPRIVAESSGVDEESQVQKFYVDSGTFGTINNGSDINVPVGTILSTEAEATGVKYRVIKSVTLPAAANVGWVAVESTLPGDESPLGPNTLVYHQFVGYADADNETLLTSNDYAIANGTPFESDANYRYRLSQRVLEAESSNEVALRLAALTTPGVSDVVTIPRYRGVGTFGIIVKAEVPITPMSLLLDVQRRVAGVQSGGEVVYIKAPKITGVTMKMTVYYRKRLTTDELDEIEDTFIQTIRLNMDSLGLGDSFEPNRLAGSLFTVSPEISGFGSASKPFDEIYIYKETRLGDGRVSEKLLGDYTPTTDEERVIIEPTVNNPIVFVRKFEEKQG
jgi:uncharacterized phage protein gp47/JayE